MSPLALALVVAAALLHATWNLAAKKAGGDHHFALVAAVLTSVLWAPLALWFGWREVPLWSAAAWFAVAASALIHVLYFQALLKGYRVADLTVVYPVARGSGPLLSAAAAVLLLGETLSAVGALGVVAVCGGVFLIAGGPALLRQGHDPAARERVRAGIRWGALTGALIAGYTVVDAYTVKVLLVSPLMLDWVGNVLRLPFLAPLAVRDLAGFRTAWRTTWKHALVVAVLGPLAYIMVLYAMTMAPLSHVAPAREMSMLFAALIGGRLLGEGDRGLRIVGAACIAAGVMALAVG
jgi:drug/metabolite transporter (DMT)-like permease